MTQLEIYKSFQFMAELLLAEFVFSYHLRRRSYFLLRFAAGVLSCFLLSYFFPVEFDNAFYLALIFLILFVWTVFVAWFLFKESFFKILFCMIAGYTLQHMTYEIFNIAINLMGVNSETPMGFYGSQMTPVFSNPFLTIFYFWVYIMCYFIIWFIFGRKMEEENELKLSSNIVFVFVVLLLLVDVLLNALVTYYVSEADTIILVIIGTYNVICCVFGLYLQFEVLLKQQIENILDTVTVLHEKEKSQYEMSAENIKLINMKCHDMKHQIRQRTINSLDPEAVAEIENLISIYDCTIKTGNETLDIILTDRSLRCKQNGIRLSCIADGKLLTFMRKDDICSLFGNIIDNAMEAVIALPEEKRVIGLSIKAAGEMTSVSIYNYFDKQLEFEDGLPVTTKENKLYHGFGMKSIRNICEKYGGEFSVTANDGIFNVNLLFCENKRL